MNSEELFGIVEQISRSRNFNHKSLVSGTLQRMHVTNRRPFLVATSAFLWVLWVAKNVAVWRMCFDRKNLTGWLEPSTTLMKIYHATHLCVHHCAHELRPSHFSQIMNKTTPCWREQWSYSCITKLLAAFLVKSILFVVKVSICKPVPKYPHMNSHSFTWYPNKTVLDLNMSRPLWYNHAIYWIAIMPLYKQLWFDSLCPLYAFWHLRRPLCDGLPDALSVGKSETSSNGTRHMRHSRRRLGYSMIYSKISWTALPIAHVWHRRSLSQNLLIISGFCSPKGQSQFGWGDFSCSGFNFCLNEFLGKMCLFIKQRSKFKAKFFTHPRQSLLSLQTRDSKCFQVAWDGSTWLEVLSCSLFSLWAADLCSCTGQTEKGRQRWKLFMGVGWVY